MKITFLGTNGWYPSPTGDTPCILVETKDRYVVLDAGNGIYKLDKYIIDDRPVSLFISHFHLDHVSGLHIMGKFRFKKGIDIYVGQGREKDFKTLMNPPFTIGYLPNPENITQQKMDIRLHELPEEMTNIPFPAAAIPQKHAYGGHGYRFELEGKTIAYTGDCGFTEQAIKLAKDADVLICESAWKEMANENWGHFTPSLAAEFAKEAGVKKLILTHFGADVFPTLEDRKWAEKEAQKNFPETSAATDGMEYEI